MTAPGGRRPKESSSFRHRRRPGIRYLYSVAAIVGGAVVALRYAGGIGDTPEGTWVFLAGLAVLVLGLVSIPAYRWMNKRRL